MHTSGKWFIFNFKNARDYVRQRDQDTVVTESEWKTFSCMGNKYGQLLDGANYQD